MEVCVDSVQSAVNARKGGASRLELCAGLSEGGLTPSLGLFRHVRELVHPLPINVLIRPRAGDFCYTDAENKVMLNDIQVFKEEGASGFVIGVLNQDGTVDKSACTALLSKCRPLPVTFHRAFDWTPDPIAALEDLKDLGFDRLLTSGQQKSADLGVTLLTELVTKAEGQIIIMPGGGITEDNLTKKIHIEKCPVVVTLLRTSSQLNSDVKLSRPWSLLRGRDKIGILESTGVKEFHASASRIQKSQMKVHSSVTMGAGNDDFVWKECCPDRVKKMVKLSAAVLKKNSDKTTYGVVKP